MDRITPLITSTSFSSFFSVWLLCIYLICAVNACQLIERSPSSVKFLLAFFTLYVQRQRIHTRPDLTSGGHHDIKEQKSRGAGEIKEYERKQTGWGGSLSHFIFSFSIEVTAAFDGETDYCGISLCSRPLELQISSGQANGGFSFKSCSTAAFSATSSFPLRLFRSLRCLLLVVFHLCVHVFGAYQI